MLHRVHVTCVQVFDCASWSLQRELGRVSTLWQKTSLSDLVHRLLYVLQEDLIRELSPGRAADNELVRLRREFDIRDRSATSVLNLGLTELHFASCKPIEGVHSVHM